MVASRDRDCLSPHRTIILLTMTLTSANVAVQLLATATKTLSALRERAQASDDAELKALILSFYDQMSALKEAVGRVTTENEELHRKLTKPEPVPRAVQVGETIYYFVGDQGPYCQPCYDDKKKLVLLSPQQTGPSGAIHRDCRVCQQSFYETHVQTRVGQIGGRGGGSPHGWMGS
jgi:hypothetical protein